MLARTFLRSICEGPGGGRKRRHGTREALTLRWGVLQVIDAG
jgi:hypothetical protein